jgi:hypothetical protein
MRKPLLFLSMASLVYFVHASMSQAQPPRGGVNPAARPKFSPYLNLTRTDVDPALNYYGLVRPQVNFFNSIQQLDQQQSTLSDRQQELMAPSTLPPTGHTAGFLNHTKYFMSRGGAGLSGGSSIASVPAPRISSRGSRAPYSR